MTLAAAVALCAPGAALAGDASLLAASRGPLAGVEALTAGGIDAAGAQDAYEAGRDLQELVRRSAPASPSCRPLAAALAAYAAGRVLQVEGIDRPSAADRAAGRRAAERARARIPAARRACRPRAIAPVARLAMSPAGGEAFYGAVVARAPAGARTAQIQDGAVAGTEVSVIGGRARFDVSGWAAGAHDVTVVFRDGAREVGRSRAAGAWLLPASARRAPAPVRADPARDAAVRAALAGGPRYAAGWVQDMATGATGQSNGGTPFPAASLVKLGLMAEVLARSGPRPEQGDVAHDLRALAGWSSNLAANRLLRHFGAAAGQAGLNRLGARASTYPGEYLVGTQTGPPAVSRRVTTAADMARMLTAVQAAAVGAPGRPPGLGAHAGRLMLGWLLASQQRGGNASLFAAALPRVPLAQKNGWIRAARHGAAIAFTPRGPVVLVLLTYDDAGVTLGRARRTAARLALPATS